MIDVLESTAFRKDYGWLRKVLLNPGRHTAKIILEQYGIDDEGPTSLVKNHDINLFWYTSAQKRETPAEDAWRWLSRHMDMRLLCTFMIADRVDCHGELDHQYPLVWFLSQALQCGLFGRIVVDGLLLDDRLPD